MIIIPIPGLGKCELCGLKTGKRFLTKNNKPVCFKCMRLYDPPRMTLVTMGSSSHIWNPDANKYEDVESIHSLEQCGWFVRSSQEILYKVLPRVTAVVYRMEFHEYGPGVKCLRYPDYPFFEDGIQECGVDKCRKFCKSKEPPKFEFPMRRSRFIL